MTNATPETDQSAVSRIIGIAKGTPTPLRTLLEAVMEYETARYGGRYDSGYKDAAAALRDMCTADTNEEAMDAHDKLCSAALRLLDQDYTGCDKTAKSEYYD